MSLPSVMQHLGVLEAAGLVRRRVGRVRTCAIEPQALSQAEQWINARRIEWEHRLDRLGEYLETIENEGDGDGSGDEAKKTPNISNRPAPASRVSTRPARPFSRPGARPSMSRGGSARRPTPFRTPRWRCTSAVRSMSACVRRWARSTGRGARLSKSRRLPAGDRMCALDRPANDCSAPIPRSTFPTRSAERAWMSCRLTQFSIHGRADGGGRAGRLAHDARQAGEGGRAHAGRNRNWRPLGGARHFHLERTYEAPVARVWRALTDEAAKQKWFAGRRADGNCSSGIWMCGSAAGNG